MLLSVCVTYKLLFEIFYVIVQRCSCISVVFSLTYIQVFSSDVFGENPRYCHSQLDVSHPLSSCLNLNIASKIKVLPPTTLKLNMQMHLDEFYTPHPFWGHQVKGQGHCDLKILTSFHLFKTAPAAERGTCYALLLFFIVMELLLFTMHNTFFDESPKFLGAGTTHRF